MNKNLNNKLLFIHIPKTGGTSILNKLDQSMWKKTIYGGHDPLFVLEKNNNVQDSFSFCVVRNPYKRTFSYYEHFKRVNNLDYSFLEFLESIKKKYFFKLTPMILFPQSFYVYGSNGEISVNKIYKYENFTEIEMDLNLKFKKLNIGNYNKEDYKNAYLDKNSINLVRDLFSVDFINFDYDLDDYE